MLLLNYFSYDIITTTINVLFVTVIVVANLSKKIRRSKVLKIFFIKLSVKEKRFLEMSFV